jgi:uncharacterized membrane protein (UPF0127 family)
MKYFFIILIVLALGGGFYWLYYNQEQQTSIEENIIFIAGKEIKIEVADTEVKRMKGLSGRKSLPEDSGLLFVSEKEETNGIWMKDMNFPIDIAWLDSNKKILDIKTNVNPDTYPQIFYPEKDGVKIKSSYVLETNAGFFETSGIKIDDVAEF